MPRQSGYFARTRRGRRAGRRFRETSGVAFARRLRLEPLEDRRLLSTIMVDTLIDVDDANDGLTTLREGVIAALPGDTINFAASLTSGGPVMIDLRNVGHAGEIAINKSVTINGPGANLLVINASTGGLRAFNVDDGTAARIDVEIVGLNLFGGQGESGGAIITRENLTIRQCVIGGNVAGTGVAYTGGGGIANFGGTLTVLDSTIAGNFAAYTASEFASGGGILQRYGGSLVIERSTISGNRAYQGGGLSAGDNVAGSGGNVQIRDSTISGNTSQSRGGGVYVKNGSALITGSTISGNKGAGLGGGIWFEGSDLTVKHTTIAANEINVNPGGLGEGGGLAVFGNASLDHAIVAGNTRAAVRDDVWGNVTARFSLIGDDTDATITDDGGNLIGTGAAPIDPGLGPLGLFGGPTQTHPLLADSPALDAGDSNSVAGVGGVPFYDQRGDPFTRVHDGNGAGGPQIDMGAFERQPFPAGVFVVDTLVDEEDGNYSPGDRSLRELIGLVNFIGGDEITFAASLTSGGHATIMLTEALGELAIRDPLTIQGPGAGLLTIQAFDPTPANTGDGSRVLNIDDDTAESIDVVIVGLTLTGGDLGGTSKGGGIYSKENLTLAECTISGNAADFGGGGVTSVGRLTVVDSQITGNFGRLGGGIASYYAAELNVTGSTISGNTAIQGGGVFLNTGGSAEIHRSSIAGNTASGGIGGGIASFVGTLAVFDSMISGNTAPTRGGGIYSGAAGAGNLTVTLSTISDNRSNSGGGIVNSEGTAVIRHSTITNNLLSDGTPGDGVVTNKAVSANTEVYSSIIAGNAHGDVIEFNFTAISPFVSLGYNIVGNGNAVGAFTNNDQTGIIDPLLGPLADNGGPTMTHALLPGNPAIDAGDPNFDPADPDGDPMTDDGLPYDQRGAPYARVFEGDSADGARIDIGAFEFIPDDAVHALFGDYNQNGIVDAADYTTWRDTLGQMGLTPYSGADGDGNGMIDAADYAVWKSHFGQTVPIPGAGSGVGAASSTPLALATTPTTLDPAVVPRSATPQIATGDSLGRDAAANIRPTARQDAAARFQPTARQDAAAMFRPITRHDASSMGRDDGLLAWLAARHGTPHDPVSIDADRSAKRASSGETAPTWNDALDLVIESLDWVGAGDAIAGFVAEVAGRYR